MDINTLELARQLTVLYSNTMRTVKVRHYLQHCCILMILLQLKELLTLGWEDSSKAQLAQNIIKMTQLSRNVMNSLITHSCSCILLYNSCQLWFQEGYCVNQLRMIKPQLCHTLSRQLR